MDGDLEEGGVIAPKKKLKIEQNSLDKFTSLALSDNLAGLFLHKEPLGVWLTTLAKRTQLTAYSVSTHYSYFFVWSFFLKSYLTVGVTSQHVSL